MHFGVLVCVSLLHGAKLVANVELKFNNVFQFLQDVTETDVIMTSLAVFIE